MSAEITDQNEQLDIITLKVRDINRTIYMSGCIQRAYIYTGFPRPLEPGQIDYFYLYTWSKGQRYYREAFSNHYRLENWLNW